MQGREKPEIQGYELLELAGDGPSGKTYKALQKSVTRDVALKIYHSHIANQPDFIRAFESTSQRIARLEHLHVVPLYDFWRDQEGAYQTVRWLRGGNLADRVAKGPLDIPDVVRLTAQVGTALAAAHQEGIFHANLKPTNILLDEEGNAYLSDFRILASDAGQVSWQERQANFRLYEAPEQVRGERAGNRTDIFALGLILYEMVTGHHPFSAASPVEQTYRLLNEPLPQIEHLDSQHKSQLNKIVQQATSKNPTQRYGDLSEMVTAVKSILGRPDFAVVEELLTSREQEILDHIVAGQSNKQIANALFVELSTVKWHITALYRKLGVRSRRQAIVRARELAPPEQASTETPLLISEPILARPINPYKGLRPFSQADSRDFFGRESIVKRLCQRLRERTRYARFLAILGPSGSGKSSLLGAGLLPAVSEGKLLDSERWMVAQMSPGTHPIDELEIALTRIAAEQATNLHTHLTRDSRGLLRAAGLILPRDDSELLLVIDQFEELYTQGRDAITRDFFLGLLVDAVQDPRSRVRVVIAMRADFYDRPLRHPGFGELVRSRLETIMPMNAEELERAIVQPAARVDVGFEAGLIARIIEEMLYQPGALPLLQYALTELFAERDGRLLTHNAYDAMGGGVGALANKAEEIYQEFNAAGRSAARQLFLRLVQPGERLESGEPAPDTRRKVQRRELLQISFDTDIMDEVIDTFGRYRMLSLDHDAKSHEPIIELSHEALLQEWKTLHHWLQQSREDLRTYRRFQDLYREWTDANQLPGYLLRDARLDQLSHWSQRSQILLTLSERAYLDESLQARQERRADEEMRRARELEAVHRLASTEKLRAEEQAIANRQIRRIAIALAFFLFTAVSAAVFALFESHRATNQAILANARELALAAAGQVGSDPELSIHLAVAAVETTFSQDGTVLPEAEAALHNALQANRVLLTLPYAGTVLFSPDGTQMVSGGNDGVIHILDANNGELIDSLEGHNAPIQAIAFANSGKVMASRDRNGRLILWEFEARRQTAILADGSGDSAPLGQIAFNPDGSRLLVTSQSEEAVVWDTEAREVLFRFRQSGGPTAAFHPNGTSVALMTAVWHLPENEDDRPLNLSWSDRQFDYTDPYIEFEAPSSEIENTFLESGAVAFSPDGQRLVTSVVSSQAIVRDAHTGQRILSLIGHSNIINAAKYAANGNVIATVSADSTARIWNAFNGEPVMVLEGHQDEILYLDFSPDGKRLVTASLDGTLKLWDLTPSGPGEWPNSPEGEMQSLSFFPGSQKLLLIGVDRLARTFNLHTGEQEWVSSELTVAFSRPVFSPDGSLFLVSGEHGQIHVYSSDDQKLNHTLSVDKPSVALAVTPDNKLLAVGTRDGDLILVSLENGVSLAQWHVETGFVTSLLFSPNGRQIVYAGAEGEIRIVNVETALAQAGRSQLKPDLIIQAHAELVSSLELSPGGDAILSASWDGSAKVWQLTDGAMQLQLAEQSGRILDAIFSPDGRQIVTASEDDAIQIWDRVSGTQLWSMEVVLTNLAQLAFSPNGTYLAVTTDNSPVRLYVMDIDLLLKLAADQMTRQLTHAECKRFFHLDACPIQADT